jgi:hypothetical protein
MKHLKLLILTFIFAGTFQTVVGQNHAVAKIMETGNPKLSRILVSYDNGTTEVVPLNAFLQKGTPEKDNDALLDNMKIVANFYDTMEKRGYEIVTVSPVTPTNDLIPYILVTFRKKK